MNSPAENYSKVPVLNKICLWCMLYFKTNWIQNADPLIIPSNVNPLEIGYNILHTYHTLSATKSVYDILPQKTW